MEGNFVKVTPSICMYIPIYTYLHQARDVVMSLSKRMCKRRQDLQMRLLSLFVGIALNPLDGKQVWDLGALLPAIASLSHDLPAHHAVGKRSTHSSSFDILQVLQEDDANRVKVSCLHCTCHVVAKRLELLCLP